jgi:capsular polysaccharide biosynthesis protein
MSLVDYLRILVRRGWIMLLLALIASGSAYLLTRAQPPVYRGTQSVIMLPSRIDLGLSAANRDTLEVYVNYLNSSFRAQNVIDQLQLDNLAAELQSRVNVVADSLRLTIQIEVDAPTEQLAKDIAAAYGQRLVDYRNELNQAARREDRVDAQLQDVPRASQIAPRPSLYAAAGGVLGLLIGGVIVFMLEFLESSVVRRREDVERWLDLPVLTTVPADLEAAPPYRDNTRRVTAKTTRVEVKGV